MTPKQKEQFNRMLLTLKSISRDYATPKRLLADAEKVYGLSYEEVLEYSYENVKTEAANAIKGVRVIAGDAK